MRESSDVQLDRSDGCLVDSNHLRYAAPPALQERARRVVPG